MRVSIVTSSFNQAEFLPHCIESVLDQDYPDVEYIVVDAGSSDGSRDIIRRYAKYIDTVLMEPDRGHSDGMNKGFRAATGDLFNCTNSDDAFLPGAVSSAVRAALTRPSADVLWGNGYCMDREGRVTRRFISNRWNSWRFVRSGLAVMHQATFYRRAAFWQVGGFRVEQGVGNDADLLYRMARAGLRSERVDEYWGLFRIYGDSITGSGRLTSAWEEYRRQRFQEYFSRPRDRRDLLLDRVAYLTKWLGDPYALGLRFADLAGHYPKEQYQASALTDRMSS